MSAAKGGILEVFACDSLVHDVFAPAQPDSTPSSPTGVWLPAYATLSHNVLDFRHDPRLFKNVLVKEAVRQVTVDIQDQEPLGLHISGGNDFDSPVFISKLSENSVSKRCGALYVGDEILAVNAFQLAGQEGHSEVVQLLQHAVASGRVELLVQYRRDLLQDLDQFADDGPIAEPPPKCRTISIPLHGMSVWQSGSVIFDREECVLVEETDRASGKCFALHSLKDAPCLFRARNLMEANQWCSALQENVRSCLRDAMFSANVALEGSVAMSAINQLTWMRTWRLPDAEMPGRRERPSADIALVAVTDTAVMIYDQAPPASSGSGTHTGHNDSQHGMSDADQAYWHGPNTHLPVVHSRIVDVQEDPGARPGHVAATQVILRTGQSHGLERRALVATDTTTMVLWKMEFRKAWQTVPKLLGKMKFSVVWHGEACTVVLEARQDAITVFVGDCREVSPEL